MASYSTENIRTIAVVGGGGAGKTTLVDHLLFKGGAATRVGSVDDGTSISDSTAEEKQVKHSLTTALVRMSYQGCEFRILDTPGYPDFVGEAMVALAAVDAVLVVVDAAGGVKSNARRLYHAARDAGLPVFVVINKLDGDQANLEHCYEVFQTLLGRECAPAFACNATGAALSKVNSLLDPASTAEFGDQRAAFIESLVETDEQAMEAYLEDGEIPEADVEALYRKAVHGGELVPVLLCSASKDVGVLEILGHLAKFSPSPLEGPGRPAKKGDAEVVLKPGSYDGTTAQVFKTVTDPYVGRLSYLRVWTGTLQSDHPLTLQRTGKHEKLANILAIHGKESSSIPEAIAGELVAVAKVEHLESGDTLYSGEAVEAKALEHPQPMVAVAIDPKARGEEQKLSDGLRKLASEDKTFLVERNPVTHDLVVTGVTNLHVDTMIKRLKERFGVEVETHTPKVPLKETILTPADGHYRHKKQTGGAGQFGEVYLKVEPTERGSGFEFVDDTVGGSIPKNFMPAVEKGIVATLEKGVFAGYPVVDVRVKVYDGKHHPVDSNETSFKMAGAKAFKDAFLKAKPSLLEPIVNLEVEVPASAMGDITGDMNSRRGRIQGMDTIGNLQVIKAQIPLKEIQNYSTDLRSMTAGEGSYHFTFSHYDVLPAKLADEVRKQFKVTDDD